MMRWIPKYLSLFVGWLVLANLLIIPILGISGVAIILVVVVYAFVFDAIWDQFPGWKSNRKEQ